MKQLSVRGFEPELVDALTSLAEREGVSLNQAALRLMRKGAGIENPKRPKIGNALDRFIGTMTNDELLEFQNAISPCEQIDESFWE